MVLFYPDVQLFYNGQIALNKINDNLASSNNSQSTHFHDFDFLNEASNLSIGDEKILVERRNSTKGD